MNYATEVERMAAALHRDCELEWQAIAVVDPTRQVTMHGHDAHYGKAHDLVRLLNLDALPPATPPALDAKRLADALYEAGFTFGEEPIRIADMERLVATYARLEPES